MEFYSFFYRYSPFLPWEIEVLPVLILRVWNSHSSGLVLYKAFCTRNQFLFRKKNIFSKLPCKLIVGWLPKLAFSLFKFFYNYNQQNS